MDARPARWLRHQCPCLAPGVERHLKSAGAGLEALRTIPRPGPVRSRRRAGIDADGLVTCLSCGHRYRSLGPHLARAHHMTAADYRVEHRLPATTVLMAAGVRVALSRACTAAMTEDPDLIGRIRSATPPPQDLARLSAHARAGTDDLPTVQAGCVAAARRTLPAAHQARRDVLEAKARAAGFASMAAVIDATRHLPSRAAATDRDRREHRQAVAATPRTQLTRHHRSRVRNCPARPAREFRARHSQGLDDDSSLFQELRRHVGQDADSSTNRSGRSAPPH
ncbi:MucR family transcriptional regulator [Streptomyces rishiriensis]|uniref:MucR family transcriptional regulator n=1 Tax=Streptomyces rishiriensis TaxID=68264 RepID=UPI00358FB741